MISSTWIDHFFKESNPDFALISLDTLSFFKLSELTFKVSIPSKSTSVKMVTPSPVKISVIELIASSSTYLFPKNLIIN